MCDIHLCEHMCVHVWRVGLVYLALNVDCTGMFIVYVYAHLHNYICMCLLLYYALIYYSLKVYTV